MKQTIAELGIGGEGWIIYDSGILPKRVVYITVVNLFTEGDVMLLPRYLLRECIKSDGVETTKDLVVFANHTVYSTKEEAEAELHEQVSSDATMQFNPRATQFHFRKDVDWKKLANELNRIQKQFNEVTEDQKKDFYTLLKKIENFQKT